MKLDSNCFLINCDLALTMRKMCKVVEVNPSGYYDFVVSPYDGLSVKIGVLANQIRKPKQGEVEKLTRLFN